MSKLEYRDMALPVSCAAAESVKRAIIAVATSDLSVERVLWRMEL